MVQLTGPAKRRHRCAVAPVIDVRRDRNGQPSAPQTVTLTNSGDVTLTSIKTSVSGPSS